MRTGKILIISSPYQNNLEVLRSIIDSNFDLDIQVVQAHQDILRIVNEWKPDLIILIEDEPSTCEVFDTPEISVIPKIWVICTEGCEWKGGNIAAQFDDFIMCPFSEAEVVHRISRCLGEANGGEKDDIKKNILNKLGMLQVVGQDPVFLETISKIPKIAACEATVLLTGDTGVGKELCARAIHYLSNRTDMPFISVNCGALPTTLVENELFGHERGAFTDAHRNRLGMIAEAEGGTLFLDEIDALNFEAQSKLLRLLQEKTYRPLGQAENIRANIRVIAAANSDLVQQMQEGKFRADLFYRLSVVTLDLPLLRERKSDIPVLADHFLRKYGKEYSDGHKTFSPAAMQRLLLYDWPGNIRELENIIQQALLVTEGSVIPPKNVNLPILTPSSSYERLSFKDAKKISIEEFEKGYLTELLIFCGGNITHAAKQAGKDRRDFGRLVKKYDLNPSLTTPPIHSVS